MLLSKKNISLKNIIIKQLLTVCADIIKKTQQAEQQFRMELSSTTDGCEKNNDMDLLFNNKYTFLHSFDF